MSFLSDLGNVAQGIGGAVSGFRSLFGGDDSTGQANIPQARAQGAGFRSVVTPSLLLDTGSQDVGFTRLGGLQPGALEADARARFGQAAGGLAGLRDRTATDRENVGLTRGGLSDIRSRSAQLRGDVEGLRGQTQAGLSGLRGQVDEAFGDVGNVRARAIRNRRDEAVGNLRESLGRRKVLGSSFGEDAITRAELAFGEEEGKALAETELQRIETNRGLLIDEAVQAGNLDQIAGQLLSLDSATLGQELQTIAADMGLTAQDAQIFGQEIVATQAALGALNQTIQREFQEASLPANIALGVGQQVGQIAAFNAQSAILNARAQGSAIAGIGDALGDIGAGLGGIFGSFGTETA
jgi:hypothetical protein